MIQLIFRRSHGIGFVIAATVVGSTNGLDAVRLAQFLDKRILLELWSVRSEFSQKFSAVCAAGVDFRATFGLGAMLLSLVMTQNKPKPNSLFGSRGQVPLLDFSSVKFGGSRRKETSPRSRHVLELASFWKFDRAIDVVRLGRV